jgi:hypothetical protein
MAGSPSSDTVARPEGDGQHTRIAGKDYTTLDAIEEMKEKCLVPANQPLWG